MTDWHNPEGRLAKFYIRLQREKFSKQDQTLIREYLDHCRAQGVSAGRLFKIAWSLLSTRRLMNTDFRRANRKTIEQLVATLSTSVDYSPATKSDLKKILKKFYKYVRYGNADKATPYPAEVAWIGTTIKKNEVREPDIITEDEAKRMIEAAPSTVDKALVAFLFESGTRIGEALGMKLADLTFDKDGARASVSGKTGSRTVRLITSAPLLAQYAQQHPLKGDAEKRVQQERRLDNPQVNSFSSSSTGLCSHFNTTRPVCLLLELTRTLLPRRSSPLYPENLREAPVILPDGCFSHPRSVCSALLGQPLAVEQRRQIEGRSR